MTPSYVQRLKEAAQSLKIGYTSKSLATAILAVETPGKPVICGSKSGKGRYSSSKSWQKDTDRILRAAGFETVCFNEAPKGGKAGDRIYIKSN